MTATFQILKVNNITLPGIGSGLFDERESDDYREDDGALHTTSAAVKRCAPMASYTTVALRALFTLLGTGDEVPFVALDGTNGCDMLGVENDPATIGPLAGSTSPRRRFLNGLLLLDRISYRPDSIAEASISAYAKAANGTTDPVTRTSIAAPTIPVNTERTVLTGLSLGGSSALSRMLSLDIDITHQVENNDPSQGCYDGGLPYPVVLKQPGAGGATMIKAVLETLDLSTSFANGTMVATFGVLNHLGIGLSAQQAIVTLNNCLIRQRSITGPKGAAARRIEMVATFDGTNRPCTLSTV